MGLSISAWAEEEEDTRYETVVREESIEDQLPQDDPAGFATVIRVKDPLPGTGLERVVDRVPGLRVRDSGLGSRKTLSMRGADSQQVVVLLDGFRLSSPVGGGVDISLLDPAHLETVEVRRGGASARFGADAMGGVLVLRTPRLKSRPRNKVAVSYGSYNTVGARASRSASFSPKLRYLASASYRHSDGDFSYEDPDRGGQQRVRQNNDSNAAELLLKADYLISDHWQVGAINDLALAFCGAPGLITFPSATGRQQDLRNLTGLRLTRRDLLLRGDRLDIRLHHRYLRFVFDRDLETPIPEQHTLSHSFAAGAEATLAAPLGDTGRVDGGVSITGNFFRDEDTDNPERLEASLWAASQTRLLDQHLVIVPAVRLALATGFGATVVPKLGLILNPLQWTANPWLTPLQVSANLGRSFRYPSFQEMYIRLDGFGAVAGNPDLSPEDSLDWDAGLRWRGRLLSLEVAFFQRYIKNTILFAPESATRIFARNYKSALAQGLEASLRVGTVLGLELGSSYTYTMTRFGDPPDYSLPGFPPHRVASRLGWRYPLAPKRGKGRWGLELWSGVVLESAMVLDRFNNFEEESRVLLSAGGSFSWRWLTLSAEGRNLLDKRDAVDTLNYPLPPARFLISLAAVI